MTVNEFKNMKVKIRGYTMPDDNAPDFYTRCKLKEALGIMKEYVKDFPEEFYNLSFDISSEDERCLFSLRRELDKVYLGRDNEFSLTEEIAKEALGLEVTNRMNGIHFYLEGEKKNLYSCEIDPDDNPYKRKANEVGNGIQSLVVVGPEGMILAECCFDKSQIDSKAAIGLMTCRELAEMELEAEYVEWYKALPRVGSYHYMMLKMHPEKVYMTIDELGAEHFTKVKEWENTDGRIETAKQSEIRLYFTTDLQNLGDNKTDLGRVDAYAGNVGTRHLLNHAFRRANQELKESSYAEANWYYDGKKTTNDGAEIYYFVKENEKGEFAVLQVTDYRGR